MNPEYLNKTELNDFCFVQHLSTPSKKSVYAPILVPKSNNQHIVESYYYSILLV